MAGTTSRNENTIIASKENQRQDYAWFLEHYLELNGVYGNVFLAIKNKKVIGAYSTYAEAVKKTQKHEALGSFIVQECTDSEECFTARVASVGLNVI